VLGNLYALYAAGELTYTGGTYNLDILLPPGCTAVPVSPAATWLRPATTSAGPGFNTTPVAVDANHGSARQATITVGSEKLTVTQQANPCTYLLSATSVNAPANGSFVNVGIIASGTACQWFASSPVNWAQPYPLTGTASGNIRINVFPNFAPRPRTVTLDLAGTPFAITQAAAGGTVADRFVQLLYFSFFGRLPTAEETAFHVGGGLPRADLALNFFDSEEFNIGGRFVAGLYVGLLDRNAEYGGWLFQRNALATKEATPLGMVQNFMNAYEYNLKYGNPDNATFVTLLYRNILLREPTPAEVQFQASALAGMTRAVMASNFLNSREFRIGTGPRLTAFLIYATLLQRDPTSAEFADASAKAAAFRDQLLAPMLNSAEFKGQIE
jgi:hypothetical protein